MTPTAAYYLFWSLAVAAQIALGAIIASELVRIRTLLTVQMRMQLEGRDP